MIPSELFFDLVDAKVSFSIIRGQDDCTFKVSRAKGAELKLSTKGGGAVYGNASAILGRINALLLARSPPYMPKTVEVEGYLFLDDGSAFSCIVVPEPAASRTKGLPERYEIGSQILIGSLPNSSADTAIIATLTNKKYRLYLMQLFGKDSFQEMQRLAGGALPKALHAQLAAADYLAESYAEAYGLDALDAARATRDSEQSEWVRTLTEGLRRTKDD
jgi:hypothetical protein